MLFSVIPLFKSNYTLATCLTNCIVPKTGIVGHNYSNMNFIFKHEICDHQNNVLLGLYCNCSISTTAK